MGRVWPSAAVVAAASLLAYAHTASAGDASFIRAGAEGESRRVQQQQPGEKEAVAADACYEASVASVIDKQKYPFCSVLEPGRVVFYWNHDGSDSKKATRLDVAVVAKKTKDWVAIGLSGEAEGMVGMDVAMLRKNTEGTYELEDRWSTAYEKPKLDEKQDKTLTFLDEHPEDQALVYGYSMPLDSLDTVECRRDKEDAMLDQGRWAFVMWAMGENVKGEPAYHGNDNGMTNIPLLSTPEGYATQSTHIEIPEPSTTVEVFLNDMEMPDYDTYMCTYWETPQDQKYHVHQVELLGDREFVRNFVHHMFLYQIDIPKGKAKFKPGEPFLCKKDSPQGHGIPLVMSSHLALTPSQHTLKQVDAGYPLGKGYAAYWMLEVHLYNSIGVQGARGSPGFRVTYSPVLRKHDAGVVYTGAVPNNPDLGRGTNLVIPPHQPSFTFTSYCPSVCTERLLPDGPVHILFSRVHMHELGSNGEMQIIRGAAHADKGNTSMVVRDRKRLAYVEHWDFEHQEGISFEAPGVPFYPGDRLITRCTYNSTSKDNVTMWGDTHEDEMCVGYIILYPMKESAACLDLRDMRSPAFDYFASIGKPLNMSFCTVLSQYSNASLHYNPQEYEKYVYEHGLSVNIPTDELDAKNTWAAPEYFRQTCPKPTSIDKGNTHHSGRRLRKQ